jgi:peptidoglycan-associated lipoprotein
MKRSILVNLLVLGLVVAIGGFGCKTKPKGLTPILGQKTAVTGPGTGPFVGTGAVAPGFDTTSGGPKASDLAKGPEGTTALGNLDTFENFNADRGVFSAYIVYFEFDRSSVKEGERSKVEAVAAYLKTAPADNALLIEGHCDERGTEEYNRALGERRALALRDYLINLGIGAERIRTISYGKDKPVDQGHDDTAWSKNRRGEFLLLTPKK